MLRNIFEHVAGVPRRVVFDNAAGVGLRVGDAVRTTEMSSAFAAHYGFAYSFCNPCSGHEKGNVEKKVGYIRDNLFAPLPQIASADAFNARLLDRSMSLSDKAHWIKGENELQLFVEDRFAMMGLPPAPFSVVRYEVRKADTLGKVRVGGPHLYSAGALLATGRIDRASVAVGAACIAGGTVEYDEPVDLSAYDEAFSPAGR